MIAVVSIVSSKGRNASRFGSLRSPGNSLRRALTGRAKGSWGTTLTPGERSDSREPWEIFRSVSGALARGDQGADESGCRIGASITRPLGTESPVWRDVRCGSLMQRPRYGRKSAAFSAMETCSSRPRGNPRPLTCVAGKLTHHPCSDHGEQASDSPELRSDRVDAQARWRGSRSPRAYFRGFPSRFFDRSSRPCSSTYGAPCRS